METFKELVIQHARELSGYCRLELFARADREPIFDMTFTKDKTILLREQMKNLCENHKGKELLVIFHDDHVSIVSITFDKEGKTEAKKLENSSLPEDAGRYD